MYRLLKPLPSVFSLLLARTYFPNPRVLLVEKYGVMSGDHPFCTMR